MDKNIETVIVTEELLNDRIYMIRGQKVMLDYDLAQIGKLEVQKFHLKLGWKTKTSQSVYRTSRRSPGKVIKPKISM